MCQLTNAPTQPVSYTDLKQAFLTTDDSMGGWAALVVFERVEDNVREMVEQVIYQQCNTRSEDTRSSTDGSSSSDGAEGDRVVRNSLLLKDEEEEQLLSCRIEQQCPPENAAKMLLSLKRYN